jgi:hypothetical protein
MFLQNCDSKAFLGKVGGTTPTVSKLLDTRTVGAPLAACFTHGGAWDLLGCSAVVEGGHAIVS